MKTLQLLALLLFTTILFGQTKFDDDKLMLVQDIYHNSTKKNINTFMTDKGYTIGEVENDEEGYAHSFKSEFNRVQVLYNTKGEMDGVIMLYLGAPNNIFIEMKLKDAQYTFEEDALDVGDGSFMRKIWSKKGDPYSFTTYVSDEDKIGFLGYLKFD